MKKIMLFVLFLSALACAGCGEKPAETTPPVSDSSGQPGTDPTDLQTEPPQPEQPILHSFYDLNTTVMAEGSHEKLSAFSYLEADFRTRNELSQEQAGATMPYLSGSSN